MPHVDYVCMWLIAAMGIVLALAAYRKHHYVPLGIAAVFIFAADGDLYWGHYLVFVGLRKLGLARGITGSVSWYLAWTLLRLALFALAAAAAWADVRALAGKHAPSAKQGTTLA